MMRLVDYTPAKRLFNFAHILLTLLVIVVVSCQALEPIDLHSKVQLSKRSPPLGLGVSLGLFASDPLWNYQSLLDEISQLGAQQVLIVVPLHQEDHRSSTPTLGLPLSTIQKTIKQAKHLNMRVSLMPIIQLKQRRMNLWRGNLVPQQLSIWWSNYRAELKRLAGLAERENVDRLVIGAELCSLEDQTQSWLTLIKSIRNRFSGHLTYSANWDHYQTISFWRQLDEVSVNAYFPIARKSVIEQSWRSYLEKVQSFALKQHKPLLISEYGYPALESALYEPWNETTTAAFDPQLQALLIKRSSQVLVNTIYQSTSETNVGRLTSAYLWNWFGFGGRKERGFSPRKSPAEKALKNIFQDLLNR